jgi:hypothetical protein
MFVLTRSGNLNTVGRISSNEPIPNGTGRSVVYGSRTDPNLRCGMLDAEGNEVYTSKFQVVVSAAGQVSAHCVFNG